MTTVPVPIVTPEIEAYIAAVRRARTDRADLPAPPASVIPDWGLIHSARVRTWPEVDVHIEGIPHGRGDVTVMVEETRTIAVEPSCDPGGTYWPVGMYTDPAPYVVITHRGGNTYELPQIPPADIKILGELLIELADVLALEATR